MICAVRDYWDLATLLTWTLRLMEARMMLLDCPAYLDDEGTVRCGLPAEVRCRFTMDSTDGPLESAMIRCPAGTGSTAPSNPSPGKAAQSSRLQYPAGQPPGSEPVSS